MAKDRKHLQSEVMEVILQISFIKWNEKTEYEVLNNFWFGFISRKIINLVYMLTPNCFRKYNLFFPDGTLIII